jgi:hypothetical protein
MHSVNPLLRKTAKLVSGLGVVLALTALPWSADGFAPGLPTGGIAGAGADYSGAAEGRDSGPPGLLTGGIAGAGADYSGAALDRK